MKAPAEVATPELHIRGVSKTYPNGVQALKDVTLTIPGGTYGLLGPRGAGKSTLMRMLATLQEPDTGTIHLGNLDVGYLPQGASQGDRFAVLEGDAKLLILDEPTAGLDPGERVRFLNRLREQAENRTVMLSTSSVEDISELGPRMAIIHEGRILLEAEPSHAVGDLSGRVWHREITNEAAARVQREYAVISMKLSATGIAVRVYSHTAPAVGFERARPTLEDVYLSAIAGHLTRTTAAAR